MWGRVGNQRSLASPYNAILVAMAQWTVSLARIFLKMKMVPLWQSTLNVTFTCLTLSCVHKWKDNVYTTCKMFIFNRMVPPHTLHDCQWAWFVACFQEGSFHVSATSRGPQGPLIWPLVTFFFVGIPQITCLYSQTSHLVRSEGGNQGGSGNNWSRDAGTRIRRFAAKAWKLHSRKWTPPAWHYLSFIICNSNDMQLRRFFCNKIAFSLKKNKWVLIISKTSGSHRSPFTFRKSVEKIQVPLKSDKNEGYFTWRPLYIFYRISFSSS